MRALTAEEIKRITFGAIRTEMRGEGLCFSRFTAKQTDVWASLDDAFVSRAASATGIRMDFYTNSQTLAMTVGHSGKYDVYINGLMREQYDLQGGEGFTLSLNDPLQNSLADKRVTVYFPCHTDAVLTSVMLDEDATVEPHTYDLKMLMIGDSITQGWETQFDSLSYAWRVARHFNADILNQGVGGAYYCEDTFDQLPFDPDVVTVAYGTNDFGHYHTLEELREHTKKHLTLISKNYAEKRIFVITPIWRERREGKPMGRFEDCRAVIAEEAEALGLTVIDGLCLVPPMPVFFSDAYLHPNDCGMSLYAENLIIALEKYL